ncbi:hypothetical protein H9L39_09000 [Fusarium oxysporum f. sp. albedinis]|nr:hypothetical protein H9L39_09000 [Fusarium oxysporum f. sp. albedinis]
MNHPLPHKNSPAYGSHLFLHRMLKVKRTAQGAKTPNKQSFVAGHFSTTLLITTSLDPSTIALLSQDQDNLHRPGLLRPYKGRRRLSLWQCNSHVFAPGLSSRASPMKRTRHGLHRNGWSWRCQPCWEDFTRRQQTEPSGCKIGIIYP